MVATATDQIVEASAFAAENEDAVAGQVELVVVGFSTFVEAYDPEVLALKVFKGADEVDDAGDAQVLGGAGAGLDGYRAEWSGTALGEHAAIDASAIGNPEECSEVLGVFDAVESEEQARRTGLGRRVRLEQVFD